MQVKAETRTNSPVKLWVVFENGKSVTFYCGSIQAGKKRGSLNFGLMKAKSIIEKAKDPVTLARIYKNGGESDPENFLTQYVNGQWV